MWGLPLPTCTYGRFGALSSFSSRWSQAFHKTLSLHPIRRPERRSWTSFESAEHPFDAEVDDSSHHWAGLQADAEDASAASIINNLDFIQNMTASYCYFISSQAYRFSWLS